MTTAPELPYSDKVLVDVLRELASTEGVAVFTTRPADIAKRLPAHVIAAEKAPLTANVRRITDPRFAARPMIRLRSYAAERSTAGLLAADARRSLMDAWLKPYAPASGSINRVDVLAEPAHDDAEELPDGVWCFTASYAVIIRPPRIL